MKKIKTPTQIELELGMGRVDPRLAPPQYYDPMFVGVKERKFLLFLHDIFVRNEDPEREQVGSLEEIVMFFESRRKSGELYVDHSFDWHTRIFWCGEYFVYITISRRVLVYNPARREVYTRGMRNSQSFLSWAEEFLGHHIPEREELVSGVKPIVLPKRDWSGIDIIGNGDRLFPCPPDKEGDESPWNALLEKARHSSE
jgi:hypothetical protein